MTYVDSSGFDQIQVWDITTTGYPFEHCFDRTGWHSIDQGLT
jgi:hypothetical protein